MKIKILNYILLFFLIAVAGCSDNILDEEPPHFISSDLLYSDLNGFESGLNGIYASLRYEREQGQSTINAVLYMAGTDNLVDNFPLQSGFNLIAREWGKTNNALNDGYYNNVSILYKIINMCNTILEYAEKEEVNFEGNGKSADENKNRIIAEAKAIRALQYRHLSYGYGDIPLTLTQSTGSNIKTDWERTSKNTVQKFIISELKTAQEYIPIEPELRGRLTKGAVQHYLAEMYLAMNKPDSALYWADKVVNTPEYALITQRYGVRKDKPGVPFMDMFYEGNENRDQGNTEALWVFQFAQDVTGGGSSVYRRWHTGRFSDWTIDNVRAIQDTYERGGRGRSWHSLSKWAIDIYETQDDRASNFALRKYFVLKNAEENAPYPADRLPPGYSYGDTIWLNYDTDLSPDNNRVLNWPFSRKPEGTDPNNPAANAQWNDQIYLRLADTYLLKAEAEYKLGKIEDAVKTINIIRKRSNASEITAKDINIDFILDERSRELVLEEHRRWTLLRTGKWVERTKKYNKNGGQFVTDRDTIFPIPQVMIDANLTKEMPQNPGF